MTLTIIFSFLLLVIQANPCCLISNLNLLFPEVAKTVLFLLNSYPAVALISLEIFSPGLKVINNLASLLFFFGACKTGDDCAKHTLPDASYITITSQFLNLPTFFNSSAKEF